MIYEKLALTRHYIIEFRLVFCGAPLKREMREDIKRKGLGAIDEEKTENASI